MPDNESLKDNAGDDERSERQRLELRLSWLERRVAELERRLGAAPALPAEPPPLPAAAGITGVHPPSVVPPPFPAEVVEVEAFGEGQPAVAAAGEALPQVPPRHPVDYLPRREPAAAMEEGALEQTIGLKWAGWAGALVVVFGAALGMKYAYDAGWIGRVPAELRLVLMALGAFALIAAGEVVYRRIGALAAAGLFAAGVAVLFLVAYAGYGFLDVYSREVAFALMGLAALVGAGVAARSRLVTVGVLAQLGGHLAPLILGGDAQRLLPLLSYLLMLQVVALLLAWWGGSARWWALRWVSFVATFLWMAAILLGSPARPDGLPFAFILVFAGLYLAELIASAVRAPRIDVPAATIVAEQGAAVVFCLAVTAALVAGTMVALEEATKLARGGWILGYAAAYAAAGFAITRWPIASLLAIALRTLAAALAVLAVPIALSGSAVVLVWAGMAVGFGAVGARLNLIISRAASAGTWVAAVCYLVVSTTSPELPPDPGEIAVRLAGTAIPVYLALAWALSAAGLAVAWLLSINLLEPSAEEAASIAEAASQPHWVRDALPPLVTHQADLLQAARLLAAAAAGVWIIASWLALPPAGATLAILLYGWLLVALDAPAHRLWIIVQALAVMALAIVKWAMVDLLAQRLGDGWTGRQLDYLPVFNPLIGLGSLLGTSLLTAAWLRRRRLRELAERQGAQPALERPILAIGAALLALVTFALTMEIDRVIESAALDGWTLYFTPNHLRLLCFTILWCLAAGAVAAAVIRLEPDRDRLRLRLAPLGALPLVLAIKFILFDASIASLGGRPGTPIANPELLAGLAVLATTLLYWWPLRTPGAGAAAPQSLSSGGSPQRSGMSVALGLAALLIALWLGMIEIDRGIDSLPTSMLTRQVAFSLWWSVFAVCAIVGGFAFRIAGMRYFGLTLFAITLAKVFIVDLQTVGRGWRTVSFIALGLLLLGTSVLYGKFSPKLLAARDRDAGP